MLNYAYPRAMPSLGINLDLIHSGTSVPYSDGLNCAATNPASNSFIVVTKKNETAGLLVVCTLGHSLFRQGVPEISEIGRQRNLEWVNNILNFAARGVDDAALKEIAKVTTKLKASGGHDEISLGVSKLMREKLPHIVAIAILRNTSSFRGRIGSWNQLLTMTEDRLRADGKDPAKALRGLKK